MKQIVWGSVLFLVVAAAVGLRAADVPDDARRTIQAANDAWLPAIMHEDAAAVSEPYADGAVFVTATGETAVGREGVERLMRARFAAARVLAGSLEQDGIRMAGSLIYEWGHAETEVRAKTGAVTKARGRYLTVWKQDAGGRWRIIRNLSLTD